MSSQAFLWVNVGCGLLLVLLFVVGRKGLPAPSRLNLKKGLGRFAGNGRSVVHSHAGGVHFQGKSSDPFEAQMKNLNVMFMYNGHHFDAYEVFGLPAGAGFEVVKQAYEKAMAAQGSDRPFLEAAFFAIKSK